MAKQTEKAKDREKAVIGMREEMARKIAAHARSLGANPTTSPVWFFTGERRQRHVISPPTNRALRFSCRGENASISEGTSTSATDRPFCCRRSMFPLRAKSSKPQNRSRYSQCFFDSICRWCGRSSVGKNYRNPKPQFIRAGLPLARQPSGFLGACTRLIELLDTPEDIPFLSHLIQREIVYRILRTPQGERLRAIATTGDLSHRTARAIAWLRANFAKPLHMEELAAVARMGVSTLHHQFRALTAMSPLQYQKQLRLQTARQRMLMDGIDATSAAYEVGYESISQFSREYSRFFGQPPIRDIKALRDAKVLPINAA